VTVGDGAADRTAPSSTPTFAERLGEARRRYGFFLWDLDGTLVDLNVDWHALRRDLVDRLGLPTVRPLADLLALARDRGQGEDAFALVAARELDALGSGAVSIPETLAVLRSESARSAIVTNNTSHLVRAFLRAEGLPQVPFVARDQVQNPKPDPEGVLRLRPLWGESSAILIGDSGYDAELARRAGVDFLQMDRG
jgi:phosphoglycolate phosphatase